MLASRVTHFLLLLSLLEEGRTGVAAEADVELAAPATVGSVTTDRAMDDANDDVRGTTTNAEADFFV